MTLDPRVRMARFSNRQSYQTRLWSLPSRVPWVGHRRGSIGGRFRDFWLHVVALRMRLRQVQKTRGRQISFTQGVHVTETTETAIELRLGPQVTELLLTHGLTLEDLAERGREHIGAHAAIDHRPSQSDGLGAKTITPWLVLSVGVASLPAVWGLVTVVGMVLNRTISGEVVIQEPMRDGSGRIATDPRGQPLTTESRVPVFFDPKTGEIQANVDIDVNAKKLTFDLSSS